MSFDAITLVVFLAVWPVWLAWEIVLLVKRGRGVRVQTISMVAKDRGWQLVSVVYLWCGLAAHYWWNGPAWGSAVGGIVFWAVALALVAWDVAGWTVTSRPRAEWPRWLVWVRWPLAWAVLGALSGHFLFTQAGSTPWAP